MKLAAREMVMRRLVVSNHITLDGFFEGTNREIDWFIRDQETVEYSQDLLRSVDIILFGRVTYELMAGYWPSAAPDEVAQKMNSLPKVVFSRTLGNVHWNNCTLVREDVAEEIARLKQQPGKDMVILGSGVLTSFLVPLGLIDEYRLLLNPVLLGSGNPLFHGIKERVRLKLRETRTLSSGLVVLYYEKS